MFLCGGGANCDLFKKLFHLKNKQLVGFPIKVMKLPKPDQLVAQGVTESDYDRISVAYGLSFDPLDIGEIIKENDVDDAQSTISTKSVGCQKCSGTGGLHQTCNVCEGSGFV